MSDVEPVKVSEATPGYRFRDSDFDIIHTASIKDDETAFGYFKLIPTWFKGNVQAVYIEKREPYTYDYHIMKVEFDGEKVVPL